MKLTVTYFASMRDQAGCDCEEISTSATRPDQLYRELRERHGFSHQPTELAVAINDRIVGWQTALAEGDTVSLLPPVSGG